jgi:hypothetical protein
MMGIRSWLFGRRTSAPNFVVMHPTEDAVEQAKTPPLQEDVKRAQHDFVQSIIALGRANAQARTVLAQQTLLNVQGNSGHAAHRS